MVPFGFSIGDFIAATQLVHKIWQYANGSADLRTEIETLTKQFIELFNLMHIIMAVHLHEDAGISNSTQQCLELHLNRCRKHIELFLQETSAFTECSRSYSTTRKIKQIGQRWNFMSKSALVLKKLNSDFGHDLQAFRLCVNAVTADQQQSSRACLHDLSRSFTSLATILCSIPKDLGYTWEGGEFKRHITLIHATGEQCMIPLELWSSFETLHGYLLLDKHYPGHKRMLRYHYQITDCSNGISIHAGETYRWQDLTRPGGKFLLSVVIGTWEKWKSTGRYCPRCSSEDLRDAMFSGWRRCTTCDFEFNSLEIEYWPHSSEPIDQMFSLQSSGFASDVRPKDESDRSVHDPEVDNATMLKESHFGRTPSRSFDKDVPDPDMDREKNLKHVTMIYAPIFNLVFRSVGCMCRLVGDSSPFAVDIDIPQHHPCRLHFPKEVARALGVELEYPPESYHPGQDPYFNRFGGHNAFAAFIATHSVVKRSISVQKLLPSKAFWFEATRQLDAAWQKEAQRKELLDWQAHYNHMYFSWKSQYGEEQAETLQKLKEGEMDMENNKPRKRRGSFPCLSAEGGCKRYYKG